MNIRNYTYCKETFFSSSISYIKSSSCHSQGCWKSSICNPKISEKGSLSESMNANYEIKYRMSAFWFKTHFWLNFLALSSVFSLSDSLCNSFMGNVRFIMYSFLYLLVQIYIILYRMHFVVLLLLHALCLHCVFKYLSFELTKLRNLW